MTACACFMCVPVCMLLLIKKGKGESLFVAKFGDHFIGPFAIGLPVLDSI